MHDEQYLREQICRVGKLMHDFQFADATNGNISARLGDNRFLVTPSGMPKGFLLPEQLLLLDFEGNRVDEPNDYNQDLIPTSETLMHLEVYRQRPDVGGVVHAHPVNAVAITIAGIEFQDYTIPESIITTGTIAITEYATPSSPENRDAIFDLIADHDAIMLAYHGSLTVGRDPWVAYMLLETLEQTAKIIVRAHALGGGERLPEFQLEKLNKLHHQYKLLTPIQETW